MQQFSGYIPWALGCLVVLVIARKVQNYLEIQAFARKNGTQPAKKLPQWEQWVGIQNVLEMLRAAKNHGMLDLGLRRYMALGKTFEAKALGRSFTHTIDPENIKTVLSTNFKDFGVGQRIDTLGPLLGSGIFTTDGAAWEHSRAIVRPTFAKLQVSNLDTFETHVNHLISLIPSNGATVDLAPLFFRLTIDAATEVLFGQSLNTLLKSPDSEEHMFMRAFDTAQSKAHFRPRNKFLAKYIFRDADWDSACVTVHSFVDRYISNALQKKCANSPGYTGSINPDSKQLEDDSCIIGPDGKKRYVFLYEMAKETQDRIQLRNELLNVLLAGRDTTASLLSNTFFILARRPDIWAKLKAEVDALGGIPPDYDTLRGMKYTKYLLNECLRLYPVVPLNSRIATHNTVIPHGGGPDGTSPVAISAGSGVSYSVYAMHRRKSVFGDDAHEFEPERWARSDMRPGWSYLPFNGGPRICPGQQFALTEASYVVVRLAQAFDRIESRDPNPWTEGLGLTTVNLNGAKVALVREA
ncbi:Cytochrome P450 52A13 [Cytospora mali]|uniref:Cytochrome P450 52A13 n=1 Tax=Cytospora mali TaxID=578113 RepID=A0A194VB55_CYTMA|nr:Cytochrome P450 52A13 [Valsa mali var. pyri (nom. inval.)]